MNHSVDTIANHTGTQPYEILRTRLHPHCVVCSPDHPCGLCLRFAAGADDTVVAEFEFDPAVEGYIGWPHGGITSAVLDGAMTNWLFAHGLTGVTAELKVRFRHPVVLGESATVTARLKNASHPLYELEAAITQGGQLIVCHEMENYPGLIDPISGMELMNRETVVVCCERMGSMCVPVYRVLEELEREYAHGAFYDQDFDTPAAGFIRSLAECRSFMGLPFTVYFRKGQVAAATTSIQRKAESEAEKSAWNGRWRRF